MVLLSRQHFRERFSMVRDEEDRIVPESKFPRRYCRDAAPKFGLYGPDEVSTERYGKSADERRAAVHTLPEGCKLRQQAAIALLRGGSVTRGVKAGSSIENRNAESGIVSQCQIANELAVVFCLEGGIFE